ncbi:hypothetical protein HOL63_01065 [Candidatus Peregrinibacteria bacterium]|jgi:hypothetical protein|nr:hypothetical protein [Candidatus Peregrinibacteria bacterium]MBT5468322.1 hypothetical protein [Candidatus Peregrinibacteria bacterium]MBT7337218.1 hypothetical protein [Candidatus Peregrinibacteria bacterium]
MSDDKILQIQELIDGASSALKTANALLREMTGVVDTGKERNMLRATHTAPATSSESGKVVEGIFDGQNMVDGEGQEYPIPANYASKSKLVEGDGMKLTITDEGKFIYKQILPIKRKTLFGVLIQEDGQYKILCEGKAYRVLLASVTFYRAEVGDQISILLPEDSEATWGAIEAVIPKNIAEAQARETVNNASMEDGELSPSIE